VPGSLGRAGGVEAELEDLNSPPRPTAGVRDPHRHADDAALVERRVPGGLEPLRRGEDTPERRPDILAEDIGDAEVLLAIMKGHANGLDEGGHIWKSRFNRDF